MHSLSEQSSDTPAPLPVPVADNQTANSAGHDLAAAAWLDLHFQTCAPEYAAAVRAAGFLPGIHVLDAGCGPGAFLPLLAERVGPSGRLSAVDAAEEHVAAVSASLHAAPLPCPTDVRTSDVTDLPFPAHSFDALWSANVTQYLSDAQLAAMLAEARRVVRPGGRIAIKESELTALQIQPAPPTLLWRLIDAACRVGDPQVLGSLRAINLPAWARSAGLLNVRRQLVVVERSTPLRRVEAAFCGRLLQWLAHRALAFDLPAEDKALWRRLGDVHVPNHILRSPDFHYREALILVTGETP